MTDELNQDEFSGGQDAQSNWMAFLVVGDFIKGTLLNKRFSKSNQIAFPDQWVFEIKVKAGKIEGKALMENSVFNMGIAVNKKGTVSRLNNCQIGDIIGVLLEKIEPSKTKGFQDAKWLKVKTWGRDPEHTEMSGGSDMGEEPEI